ncbi:DUF202 domain-containing protein [Corynebacterium nasicanis]|uniref:DUF202 domain-containing protein n=1 Tax=Corynebacterium nasicanis TaxID=1448267 RepID=A0ABW1QA94_9CORY
MNGQSFPERSHLAWTRTALELALVSMLLLRWARAYGWWVFLLIGMLVAMCAAIALTQRWRYRETRRSVHRNTTAPKTYSVLAVTTTLVLLGLGGVALVLVPLPGGVEPGW